MRVLVEHDDGTTVDVTEGVKVCFDVVVGSMDWGSGFLDYEEVHAVKTLAVSIGVEPPYYTEDGTECATCLHYRDSHARGNRLYLESSDIPRPCRHRMSSPQQHPQLLCPCENFKPVTRPAEPSTPT